MSGSITGNFLTGPFLRPDITFTTEYEFRDGKGQYHTLNISTSSAENISQIQHDERIACSWDLDLNRKQIQYIDPMNMCGAVPGLSCVTGFFRSFIGLIHAIVHLAKTALSSQKNQANINEAHLGAYNVVRGAVEMTPFLGNLLVGAFDYYRYQALKQQHLEAIQEQINIIPQFGMGPPLLFV